MQIKQLHLPSEVIIARIVSENDETVTIEKPLLTMLDPGGQGIGLLPPTWSFLTDGEEYIINKSSFVEDMVDIKEDLATTYRKATSSLTMATPENTPSNIIT
jgi:hypothetical protein